jgi:hypothetical protein
MELQAAWIKGSKNRLRPTSDSSQLPMPQSPVCCPLAGNIDFLFVVPANHWIFSPDAVLCLKL